MALEVTVIGKGVEGPGDVAFLEVMLVVDVMMGEVECRIVDGDGMVDVIGSLVMLDEAVCSGDG